MAKKKKLPRPSRKNLAQNAEWLDEKLESLALDLDVISSMPIEEVREQLGKRDLSSDHAAFIETLNKRLPENAAIKIDTTASRQPARRATRSTRKLKESDRKAAPSTGTSERRRIFRLLSLRNTAFVSLLVILLSIAIPRFIRSMRETELPPVTAVDPNTQTGELEPPTWIEGPAAHELLRGVRYRVEGLVQTALETPLPKNPGDLTARFQMRIAVDDQGRVSGLEPVLQTTFDLEAAVFDSLLQWRFSSLTAGVAFDTGLVTIEYMP